MREPTLPHSSAGLRPTVLTLQGHLERWLRALYHTPAPEGAVLCLGAVVYLLNPFRYSFPVGYAGLFSLMIETTIDRGFALPWSVPYYGPGGIPFAYPPVGLYLAALAVGPLKIPLFTYLRFAPAILGLLALAAAYVLFRALLSSRAKALVAAFLIATLGSGYSSHLTASGIVRGLAFGLMLAGLAAAWHALQGPKRSYRRAALAGTLFGLTAATHLSYAYVFVLGLAVFAITAPPGGRLRSLLLAAGMLVLGGVVAAPWWATVISRYGLGVFRSALDSHGSLGVFSLAADPWALPAVGLRTLARLGRGWVPAPLFGMGLLGMGYSIARKRWPLPLWFLAVLLFTGEADRYLTVIAAAVAADLLVDGLSLGVLRVSGTPAGFLLPLASLGLILGFCFGDGLRVVASNRPVLTPDVLEAADWMLTETPEGSSYILASEVHDLAEWLPYLTHRVPVLAEWGAEWTGRYDYQWYVSLQMEACAAQDSFACVIGLFQSEELDPDYLLVPAGLPQLTESLSIDPGWFLALDNPALAVYGHRH